MSKRRWLIPLAALGAALFYGYMRRDVLKRRAASLRTSGMPSAGMYDVLAGIALRGLHAKVAEEVAASCPVGLILDAGCGPGHLAVELARVAPGVQVVGVDVDPSMIAHATQRTRGAGLADRVRFETGDVAALPFQDAQFDLVVSTFSFHHWSDLNAAIREIHRVLRPGGQALIYDVPEWLVRAGHGQMSLAQFAEESRLGAGSVKVVRWPGPLPLVRRLAIRKRG